MKYFPHMEPEIVCVTDGKRNRYIPCIRVRTQAEKYGERSMLGIPTADGNHSVTSRIWPTTIKYESYRTEAKAIKVAEKAIKGYEASFNRRWRKCDGIEMTGSSWEFWWEER